ncbi:MAG: hypothetical protein M0P16_08835 [Syntrophales bacterium]|nr:hypothetical protein [Syntrophales bacterium]MCK9391116.1 hypothetical protein [Syntrophales bacterium]
MQYRAIVLGIVIIAFLSGCAVIGRNKDYRPFDEQVLTQVKPGQTTAAEVTKMFGAPSQIVKLANGNAYVYDRTLSKATGVWLVLVTMANYDIQHDRIVFFINKNDVVTHYGSSFKTDTAAFGTPF